MFLIYLFLNIRLKSVWRREEAESHIACLPCGIKSFKVAGTVVTFEDGGELGNGGVDNGWDGGEMKDIGMSIN